MAIQLVGNAVIAGRFRLNHPIGRGGMGSVWHATHLGLDIPCAIKFIEGEFASVAEAQARFEREAKAAAILRSPHVVQILDHGVYEGTPYIAMELLDGEDLGKRLQRAHTINPRETHAIISQVCRALTKAHGLGIVHRDLKPDNIFLVRDDDREIAKVLDFGIAKRDQSALQGGGTKTGAMLGTPYYMSPEQAQGVKTVDHRSDLWSLAVIVYQCITGALPFESEALGDLFIKIIVNPLPVPSRVAQVPSGFDAWWARAAARDPNGRFASAKDFSDSLGLVFGVSQASGVMDRSGIEAALGSAGSAVAPKSADVLRSSTGSMARTFDEPTREVSRSNKGLPLLLGAGGLVLAVGIGAGIVLSRGRGEGTLSAAVPALPPAAPSQASAVAASAPAAATPIPSATSELAAAPSTVAPLKESPSVAPVQTPPPTKEATQAHAHSAPAPAKPAVPKPAAAKPGGQPQGSPKPDLGF